MRSLQRIGEWHFGGMHFAIVCDYSRSLAQVHEFVSFVEKYDFSSNAGIFLQFENSRADNCLSFPLLQFCFGVRK